MLYKKLYQFCCGQSTGIPVEKAPAVMAFTASIHTEVNPLFSLFKLRPASEKPQMLLRVFWHTYLSFLQTLLAGSSLQMFLAMY